MYLRFFIACLFCVIHTFDLNAQIIQGKVIIHETAEPLINASVYFDGMYKGAVTDKDGVFRLAATGSNQIPLIISAIGYYSTSITNYSSKEFITIHLQPRVYTLDAVIVNDDGMSRAEKEAIFVREFIGVSPNAKQCYIENIDDVRLVYNRKKKVVEAFSETPIVFVNKALGFKVIYHLVGFSYSPGRIYFAGNYFFEPDSTLAGEDLAKVKSRRNQAYQGSRMHFIRSLYQEKLGEEGFLILTQTHQPYPVKRAVREIDGRKHINIPQQVAVVYKGRYSDATSLKRQKRYTYIENNGFYDPQGVVWSGAMANQRMADLLPFEYDPGKD